MSPSFFRHTGGFFEQLHPASKLIALALAFIPPFFSSSALRVLPYFALLLLTALIAGAGPHVKRMAPVMSILFIMSLVVWSLFPAGPVHPGDGLAGVRYGAMIGIRLNCFVLATLLFLTCTRIEDVTQGLSTLGLPFSVSFTVSLAFRLTPLFMDTARAIALAQKARGLDLESGGPWTRVRRHVPIIVPVIVSGIRRADQLAVALESKGFGHPGPRTLCATYAVTWRDATLLISLSTIIVLAACWA